MMFGVRGAGFVVWVLLASAVAMGGVHGLQATSLDDARLDTQKLMSDIEWEDGPRSQFLKPFVMNVAQTTFNIASAASLLTYQYGSWIPKSTFTAFAYLNIAAAFAFQLRKAAHHFRAAGGGR